MNRRIVLVVQDVRSTHNVGSLLRTADGLGITKVYLCGYTPYPEYPGDPRLLHQRSKATRQIAKTALGAEKSVAWEHCDDVNRLIERLRGDGYTVAALEQTPNSILLPAYSGESDVALLVGNEVDGVDQQLLRQVDLSLEIPMAGQKESYNVAVAAAIALYHLRFVSGN